MHLSTLVARRLSLTLLIAALTEYGYLHLDPSGTRPGSFGLTRLERDLSRRGIGAPDTEIRAKIG